MLRLTTSDFPSLLPRLLAFEAKSFGDYPYTPAPERLTTWWQAGAFFTAAVADEAGNLDGLFTALATTKAEYELFRQGKLSSSKAMQPHPFDGSDVYLYIPTLIVGNRSLMPVLFKLLLKDLEARLTTTHHSVKICFATAADKRATFLLTRFGFAQTGAYKDAYKIMAATKDSCALLRNFVR